LRVPAEVLRRPAVDGSSNPRARSGYAAGVIEGEVGSVPVIAWVVIAAVVLAIVAVLVGRGGSHRPSHPAAPRSGADRVAGLDPRADGADDRELATRIERPAVEIRPLGDAVRESYSERWAHVQAAFAERPQVAVTEADELAREVMLERGYPVHDDARRLADVSVDHPDVMDHFRIAMALAAEAREDRATPERLRQAMVHYRALFGRLLAADDPPT
jgi:hypothetical protein